MRRVLLLLGATALTVALASPASAHTRLLSSTPSSGAVVQAPVEVVLVFSDPVQPDLSAMSVTGADGEDHVVGPPTSGPDGSSVSQALRTPLEPGAHRVAYRVLAADGHPVTGTFAFTATAPASAAPTPRSEVSPTAVPPTTDDAALRSVADETPDDGGLPVLPLVGGLVVAAVAGLLARRLVGPTSGA